MASESTALRQAATLLAVALVFCLLGGTVSASETLALRPGATVSLPDIEIISSGDQECHLSIELPALEVERYELDGISYQTLSFPTAQLQGEIGQPALPAFTRFVAIPARAGAALRVISREEETLDGIRLLPMQDEEGNTFALNDAVYRLDEFVGDEAVSIGAPAVMRNVRVVPLTFRPLRYNPARQEVRVLRRVELAIDFAGVDLRNALDRADITPTRDFSDFCRSVVVNFGRDGDRPLPETFAHRGTWLIVTRDDATVLSKLQPLLDWRKRMGYNVVVATTTQTGTSPQSIKAWIQNAYNSWDDPPEYVVITGDVSGSFSIGTFNENYSGCYGEGDHPYVQLAGDDLLPEAFIGRLSAEDTNTLELIVNKIVKYESNPFMDIPWFSRACLVGDPNGSGISCIQLQQWLKEKLRRIGFTRIDTVWTSPFVTQMAASVNAGVSYFGYRGYWGTSGWDNTDVFNLTNDHMLPFAINLTCGTGSFASGTSLNEAWLRAGIYPSTGRGGIGSIATATTCTHTRYNNCFYCGAAYGLYWEGHYQLGKAHARGKIEMVYNYGQTEPSLAGTYIYWNNLMGDPATEVWTATPQRLSVSYPPTVPIGVNLFTVSVARQAGGPVEGAWVYLYRSGQIGVGGYTDASGSVELPIDASIAGTVLVTVTGHDLFPHRGNFAIAQQAYAVSIFQCTIDDNETYPSEGNGDGVLNPGETIVPHVVLRNTGTQPLENLTLTVSSDDPLVGVLDPGPVDYGTIAPGALGNPIGLILLRLAETAANGDPAQIRLHVQSGLYTWTLALNLPVSAPDLMYKDHALTGVGTQLDPGETGTMIVTLQNISELTAEGPIQLSLVSDSYSVQVTDPDGVINSSIAPAAWGSNSFDAFGISSPVDCVPGQLANLHINYILADGKRGTVPMVLPVGTADSQDPTGPDAYGYLAFDQTDVSYPEHPTYSWVEINPNSGGPGTDVGLQDYGGSSDDSEVINLPFPFKYYGTTFTRATICSNGWMSMGHSYIVTGFNWSIPSAEAPAYLIAPFWDGLYLQTTGKVYRWYDSAGHRFVVAWDNVKNEYSSSIESFEVILYDPAYFPTYTGDGVIVFQYETLNNNDYQLMYSTCGIEDGEHTTGILYNYYNRKPATAANYAAGLAIKFTTQGPGASDAHATDDGVPRLQLHQNTPNPFQGGTLIRFDLDRERPIALRIFNVDGQLVRALLQGTLSAGPHAIDWTGHDDLGLPVPAGVYFYKLETGEQVATRKLLLLR